jgi:hypothetical protein
VTQETCSKCGHGLNTGQESDRGFDGVCCTCLANDKDKECENFILCDIEVKVSALVDQLTSRLSPEVDSSIRERLTSEYRFWRR